MFCVAICDDEETFCIEIENYLETYVNKKIIETEVFYSGEKLYEALLSGRHFDLIFLDIELKLLDGVEVGKKIREELKNEKMHIVFVSAKKEYAMDLFDVRPLHFLVKPISQKQIINVMNKAMNLSQFNYDFFEFKVEQAYHKCYYSDVLFLESRARKIIIHTVKGEYTFYGKLNQIEEETNNTFLRIHQSYLINLRYLKHYEPGRVTMLNGKELPISKAHSKIVRYRILKEWRNT